MQCLPRCVPIPIWFAALTLGSALILLMYPWRAKPSDEEMVDHLLVAGDYRLSTHATTLSNGTMKVLFRQRLQRKLAYASLVVEGTIVDLEQELDSEAIFPESSIRVSRVLRGRTRQKKLMVSGIGPGHSRNRFEAVEYEPTSAFRDGDRIVLFLRPQGVVVKGGIRETLLVIEAIRLREDLLPAE